MFLFFYIFKILNKKVKACFCVVGQRGGFKKIDLLLLKPLQQAFKPDRTVLDLKMGVLQMANQVNTFFREVGSDDVLDFHNFVFTQLIKSCLA